MKQTILLFFILIGYNLAQTRLDNEEINSNIYNLQFSSRINYSINKIKNRNVFVVKDFYDESKSGSPRLPSHDIFISLPVVEKPTIKYNILSEKFVNAIPEFNPEIKVIEEDIKVYEKAKILKPAQNEFIVEKGYLWIGNTYCLHLTIYPVRFVNSSNRINIVEKFEIELSFSNKLPNLLSKDLSAKKDIICNTKFNNILSDNKNKFDIVSDDSWIDYSNHYLKVGVAADGIYRISYGDLISQSVIVSTIDPNSFKMFLKGVEIPIFVNGETDNSFDETDFIEFVGERNMGGKHHVISEYDEPYNEYLGRYTDTTVYWLTWNGVNGRRVIEADGQTGTVSDTLLYYSQTDHYEKNTWFDFSCANLVRREMPYWIENKTWYDWWVGVSTYRRDFVADSVYHDGDAKFTVKLQDAASDISTNAHLVALSLNSESERYDSTYLDKYEKAVITAKVQSSKLIDGINKLNIHSYKTEASINGCFFDWYEIEYPRYLVPFGDSLNFSFKFLEDETVRSAKLQNVNSKTYSIWKYGSQFKKYNVINEGGNIVITDTVSSNDKFTFIDEAKIKTPVIYYVKQFTNLRNSQNKADYVAITHPQFKSKTDEYVDFITQNYNLETKVVSIDDIYDEFSYGFFNPEAIKDFLKVTKYILAESTTS